jgi:hypothetical protein
MANFLLRNFSDIGILILWASMWTLGGLWLVRSAFHLRPEEEMLVGFSVGLIADTWLANLLSQFLPLPQAFWFASAGVFMAGILLLLPRGWREFYKFKILPMQWIMLAILAYTFTGISRGLAIYDDYAHLPTTSMMAAGDLPPHFSLDPTVSYGYHHFLMLFAAQLMRLGGLYPWNALDVGRGLSFGLAIVLTAVWTQRLTRSKTAGIIGGMMAAFGMGTRWLLLFLPSGILQSVSQQIHMLGSAAQTAPDLASALLIPWGIAGGGPIAFPFAFANGILSPGVMAHGPNGSIGAAVAIPILLTFNRWRDWRGMVVSIILFASTTLMSEVGIFLSLAGWGLVTIIFAIQNRTIKLPATLWKWWLVLVVGSVIGLLQGGALTDLASGLVDQAVTGTAQASYQTVGFHIIWPPEIVSSHLGVLSLINPAQLLTALLEIGPIILVLPLLLIWGVKALRFGRWYEASIAAATAISFVMIFVEFSGSTGVRNTARLYGFIGTCLFFAVPLVWIWAKKRSDTIKAILAGLGLIIMLGGVVLFGVELPGMQKPVYSDFITDLDVLMERDYWNKLEPGVLIFDPIVSRAPTLFGRATDSNYTWYKSKPEWEKLNESPRPEDLRAYGFSYAYLDNKYWDELKPDIQKALQAPCVIVVKEVEDWKHDNRKLLDIRECIKP